MNKLYKNPLCRDHSQALFKTTYVAEVLRMNAKWENRHNRYFAYARHSWRDNGKIRTTNKYLGRDIRTAVTTLWAFGSELKIDTIKLDSLAHNLAKQGQELGIKPDNNKTF